MTPPSRIAVPLAVRPLYPLSSPPSPDDMGDAAGWTRVARNSVVFGVPSVGSTNSERENLQNRDSSPQLPEAENREQDNKSHQNSYNSPLTPEVRTPNITSIARPSSPRAAVPGFQNVIENRIVSSPASPRSPERINEEPYIVAEPLSIVVDGIGTSSSRIPPGITNTSLPPGVNILGSRPPVSTPVTNRRTQSPTVPESQVPIPPLRHQSSTSYSSVERLASSVPIPAAQTHKTPVQQFETPKPNHRNRSNRNKHRNSPRDTSPYSGAPPGIRVPKDHIFVETEYGSYIIPDFRQMTPELQQRHRDTLTLQFQILNNSWRRYGLTFAMPTPEEDISNVAIRYKQSVRYIMARSGADLYKILLVIAWLTFEIICVKFGLKASGYTKMQLHLYDIYHVMLIEMGETQGFGEGWAPWIRILIISCVSAVAFVLLSTVIGNGNQQSEIITRLLAQFITGGISNVTTETNEHGVPQPASELDSIGNALGGIDLSKLGNIDISSILATLGTAFTSNMQNAVQKNSSNGDPSNTSEAPGPRRRQRRGPTFRS